MLYNWSPYSANYIALAGHKDALVRIKPSPDGTYLWQLGKRYGTSPTIEDAKAWVEGLADHYSIPKEQRWMSL